MRYFCYLAIVDMTLITVISAVWGKLLGIYISLTLSLILGTVALFILAAKYDTEDCGCPSCQPFGFAAMINLFLCIGAGLICIFININQGSL